MAVFRAFASLIRLLMRVRDTHSNAVLQLLLGRRNMLTLEFTYSADYLAGGKTPYVQPVLRFRRTRFTSRSHPYLILTKLSKPVFMRLAEIHTLWSQKLLATLKTAALETIT